MHARRYLIFNLIILTSQNFLSDSDDVYSRRMYC